MKLLKKNQFVILVIGLMLVTAGYLNYTATSDTIQTNGNSVDMAALGDAQLVSSEQTVENKEQEELNNSNNQEEDLVDENQNPIGEDLSSEEKQENLEQTNQTAAKPDSSSYFVSSRLERDTMYSQMLESYQKIVDSNSAGQEQKAIATTEITKINQHKNAIMIAENLIKTKGLEDCILFVNDTSISCIVKADQVEQETIAQIQNIITRELKVEIEQIHISNKS